LDSPRLVIEAAIPAAASSAATPINGHHRRITPIEPFR
jgi:hypothetical protein